MLKAGDVVWLIADTLRHPKPKMHVCVSPARGWYFRINTRAHFLGSIAMPRFEHPFLDHDSHIEGGALLDIHDSVIEDALRVPSRLVGRLHADMMERLARHVAQLPTLTQDERDEILASLSAPDGV